MLQKILASVFGLACTLPPAPALPGAIALSARAPCDPASIESLPAYWRGRATARERHAARQDRGGLDTDARQHFLLAAGFHRRAEALKSPEMSAVK